MILTCDPTHDDIDLGLCIYFHQAGRILEYLLCSQTDLVFPVMIQYNRPFYSVWRSVLALVNDRTPLGVSSVLGTNQLEISNVTKSESILVKPIGWVKSDNEFTPHT